MNEWIVSLYPPTPPVTLSGNTVFTTLPPNTTSSVYTLNITGATAGQLLCFAISLQSLDVYGYEKCCCTSSQKHCVVMPICSTPGSSLTIYPNPANDLITIDNPGTDRAQMIVVYDMMGKIILEQPVTDPWSDHLQLPIKVLNRGTYLVQLVRDNSVSKGIFVKQ